MKQASRIPGSLVPFACAAALAGCTTSGGTGTLTASWSLQNLDGSPAACTSGYATMMVSAFPWDKSFAAADPGVTPFVGMFDCAAGSGTLVLPLDGTIDTTEVYGKYDLQWDETDSSGGTSVATDMQSQVSRPLSVDLGGGAASATVTMYQDGGYGWFDWDLYGATAQNYLDSCAGAGVDKIDVAVTEITTMVVTHVSFPCSTTDYTATGAVGLPVDDLHAVGAGISPLLAGDYTFVATAYAGTTVVGMQTSEGDTTIRPRNKIGIDASLAPIVLTTR